MEVVSYVRVSTQRQGQSGLGLEAQRTAVAAYCAHTGGTLLREYREVESGRKNDRPVLREAIAFARGRRARLVIGKLDRLARNVAFIANLMESDVDFAAADVPEANRLLLHIMAAVAENEAKAISDRTVAALAAAKGRGTPLGAMNPKSRNLTPEAMERGRLHGGEATKKSAEDFYAPVLSMIRRLREEGLSFAAIASNLTAAGFSLRRGGLWNAAQVQRVLKRAAQ